MQRARRTCAIPLIIAVWAGMTVVCVAAVGAAGPGPSLVAQGATAPATGSAVTTGTPASSPSSSAPSGSSTAGTPPVAATVDTGSAAAPPEPLPVVDTSSGPDRQSVIITLIGVIGALIVIPLGAWGLIRLIATAGKS